MYNEALDITSPFLLRRYQPGDEVAIWDLHERVLRQVDAFLPGPWNDDLHDIPAAYLNNGGEFLVGVIDDRIVAMGAFRRTDDKRAELKRMRVELAHQGHGYGGILLRELEARARELGYETCTWTPPLGKPLPSTCTGLTVTLRPARQPSKAWRYCFSKNG